MRAWGSRYARLVLERCDNNKRKACRVLDISYHTLQAYLQYTPKLRAAQKALPPPSAEAASAAGVDDEAPASDVDAGVGTAAPVGEPGAAPATGATPTLAIVEATLVAE
jgi:hypothetical protein